MNELKKDDEIYCPECGKPIKRNAVICVNCGVHIKELKTFQVQMSPSPKSKVVAIILAVLLGLWSWLYTYKKDYKKFWIFLGLFLFVIVLDLITITLGNLIISYSHSFTYYQLGKALTNFQGWQWTLYFISISALIWALCNSIIRPKNFYKNYPNG
jgi:hypothetical protein